MFSVVIPLYNKERSIGNTIKSVLNQTFQDLEIVVVNDGSTDGSIEVVEQFNDERIRLIHQENKGVSAARNNGIKEAKYEWITFLDGDDLWKENHLVEYYQVIKNNKDINWILSGYSTLKNKKTLSYIYNKEGVLNNVFDDLLSGLKIHTSTVCVKKCLYDEYHDLYFRVGVNNSEDREVWYKLCIIDNAPYYIKEPLSLYDIAVPNSLTKIITDNDHFLTMSFRLENFSGYDRLVKSDQMKLNHFIFSFNKIQIKERYVKGTLKKQYKEYLTKHQYNLLKRTICLPRKLKRIVTMLFIN